MTDPPEAFALVTDETRASILAVLAERQRDAPDEPALAFAALRKRTGARDSGNFNYHLGKLRDRFVTQEDEGYRLTPAGMRLASTLLSGAHDVHTDGPYDLDADCPGCEEPLSMAHENGVVRVTCGNGHQLPRTFLPRSGERRTPGELVELVTRTYQQQVELAVAELCPICRGRLSLSLQETGHEAAPLAYAGTCEQCGLPFGCSPALCVVRHPAVVSFWYGRGVDVRETPPWELPVWESGDAVVSAEAPTRVEVTLELDGDELCVTLDEHAAVVEVDGPRPARMGTFMH